MTVQPKPTTEAEKKAAWEDAMGVRVGDRPKHGMDGVRRGGRM